MLAVRIITMHKSGFRTLISVLKVLLSVLF